VAKKKDSVALFELLSKTKEKQGDAVLQVPDWMTEHEAGPVVPTPAAPQSAAPVTPKPAPPPPRAAPVAPRRETPTMASPSAGRAKLTFSVSYTKCFLAFAVLLVLLFGAFLLGRATAGPAQTGDHMDAKFRTEVLGQGNGRQGQQVKPERIRGKYYLIVQRLKDTSASAAAEGQQIVDFLRQNGQWAEVKPFRTQSGKKFYAVWSLQAFEVRSGQDNLKYAEKIEKLGQKYFRQYGSYKFQQRRSSSAALDPTYVQYR